MLLSDYSEKLYPVNEFIGLELNLGHLLGLARISYKCYGK